MQLHERGERGRAACLSLGQLPGRQRRRQRGPQVLPARHDMEARGRGRLELGHLQRERPPLLRVGLRAPRQGGVW